MLRITIETHGELATLYCSGRVVFGIEIETLRSITKSRTERRLHLDLSQVETLDAAGLGLLVELKEWAASAHRNLDFVNASGFVQRVIALTHLSQVLSVRLGGRDEATSHGRPAVTALIA